MEWVLIAGLVVLCIVLHKFIIYFLGEKEIILSQFKRYLLGWMVVILVFCPFWYYIESTRIKDGGRYYVNLFEKTDAQKNYRVPGLIYKDDYGFHLHEVYWSNGGSLSFENGAAYSDLIVGEKVSIKDDKDKEWYVELTKEKVNENALPKSR